MKKLIVLLILAGLVGFSFAEQKHALISSDDMNVLFVGNSYTYYNDMVGILSGMVEGVRANKGDIGKLVYDEILAGGATLQRHWDDPKINLTRQLDHRIDDARIKSVKRDFIVLQEHSFGPLTPASRDRMFKYARLICQAAKDKGVTPVFFMTWARRVTFDQDARGKMANRRFMYEEMHDGQSVVVDPKILSPNDGIAKTYRKIADELDAKVAPCGIAFAKAIKAGIVVHRENEKDGSHPNVTGSYLVACVFYGTIYDRNPEDVPDDTCDKIKPAIAARLQTIAKQAVQEEKLRKEKLRAQKVTKTE